MFDLINTFLTNNMPEWMRWSVPTFIIFVSVMTMLVVMTIWDTRNPSEAKQGFMPVAFTRGERMFLFILILIGTHILFIAFDAQVSALLPSPDTLFASVEGMPERHWAYALPVALVLGSVVAKWG